MRKFILLTIFFGLTPVLFVTALVMFLSVTYHAQLAGRGSVQSPKVAFAALPASESLFTEEIKIADSRTELLRQFFSKYKSPLEPYAQEFVKWADTYDLDFRLLPAIAMQESNLCTKNREGSNNCWGFGVYGTKYKTFESYPQAIETISKTLAIKYRDKHGLVTPDEIQQMYTPSSNGSWAFSVNHFMASLE
ncbi:MAG: hypothetical protein KBC15_02880 [Candidatus Levybacteria bacterium]|nr:hypothetical protein [Candidatus Levybacteria bacterium]